jgi:hypothetical protein
VKKKLAKHLNWQERGNKLHIVFWSNVHGQTGVTSNLAAISLYMALNYRFKILLMHNEYNNSSLDETFISKYELDNKDESMFDVGIDALARYSKYNKLDKESIENYTISLIKDKLDLLVGTSMTNKKVFYKVLNEVNENIFYNSSKYYDFIFSDATAGNNYSLNILESADLIVVNLNQNIRIIKRFFESEIYSKYNKKCVYILGMYNEKSRFTRSTLNRKFVFGEDSNISKALGKNNKIGTIPYNISFSDSVNGGKIIDYFLKNIEVEKKNINYYFFNEIEKSVEMILNYLGIDIKMNKLGESND